MIVIFNDERDDKMLLKILKLCKKPEEVDQVFGLFGVSEYSKKANLLNRVMGADETHYVGVNNYPDAKQQYELNVQMFAQGAWRDAVKIAEANKILDVIKTFDD